MTIQKLKELIKMEFENEYVEFKRDWFNNSNTAIDKKMFVSFRIDISKSFFITISLSI